MLTVKAVLVKLGPVSKNCVPEWGCVMRNFIEVPFLRVKQLLREKAILCVDARDLDDVVEIAEYDPEGQFDTESINIQRNGGDEKWNARLLSYMNSGTFVGLPSLRAFDTRGAITLNSQTGMATIDTSKKLISSDGGGRQRVLRRWKDGGGSVAFQMAIEVLLDAAPSDGRNEFLHQSKSRKIDAAHKCSLLIQRCIDERDYTLLNPSKHSKDGLACVGILVARELNRNPGSVWYGRIHENNKQSDAVISDWTFSRSLFSMTSYMLKNKYIKLEKIARPQELTEVMTPIVHAAWQGWHRLCPEIFDGPVSTNARKGAGLFFNLLIPSLYNFWHKKFRTECAFDPRWVSGVLEGCPDMASVNFWHTEESSPDKVAGKSRHIGPDESTRATHAHDVFRSLSINKQHAEAPILNIYKKAEWEKEYRRKLKTLIA